MMRNGRLVLLLGVPVGCSGETAAQPVAAKIIAPPGGGVYLGAYNWGGDSVSTFEQILGRHLAIGNPYPIADGGTENTWPSFDAAGHEQNWQAGYVTWYGIESALGVLPNPLFIPQGVIDGNIDSYLIQVAQDIRDWGRPVFWMYPREPWIQPGMGYDAGGYGPNGDLNREQTINQGFSDTSEYGDPSELDGPERYRDMCRHIHDVVSPIAPNVTWVMGAITLQTFTPTAQRIVGRYVDMYPGNDVVDWHALDVYGFAVVDCAPPDCDEDTGRFLNMIEPEWSEALSLDPNKPMMIVEFGVLRNPGDPDPAYDRSAWFQEFFQAAKTTHTELGGFIYWQFPGQSPGAETAIFPGDPCVDEWFNEMNGPDAAWWHSSVVTDAGPTVATVSDWGVIVMAILMLTVGSALLRPRLADAERPEDRSKE